MNAGTLVCWKRDGTPKVVRVLTAAGSELLRRAMAAETEAALLRAAIDQKHAEYEYLRRHAKNGK